MRPPAFVGIEPLPPHAGYLVPYDFETNPDAYIYVFPPSWTEPVKLEGAERAEVRRWILGGLALERLARRYAEQRAEERLFSSMGVPADALYPKRRS